MRVARAVRADAADVRRDALDLAVELAGRNPRALGASFESDARAWLQLVPPDERVAALTRIVALVDRRADLAALRADVLDELTRARPDDPALWLALGEARAQLGDRAAARVAFEQHVAHANHPGPAAEAILKAAERGAVEAYVPWQWGPIMSIIRAIPSFLFSRTNI